MRGIILRSTVFKLNLLSLHVSTQFYTVVDASGNQVFMAVYHSKEEINLYTSDQSGLNYSLSLDHIVGPSAKDWVKPRPKFGVHVVSR